MNAYNQEDGTVLLHVLECAAVPDLFSPIVVRQAKGVADPGTGIPPRFVTYGLDIADEVVPGVTPEKNGPGPYTPLGLTRR